MCLGLEASASICAREFECCCTCETCGGFVIEIIHDKNKMLIYIGLSLISLISVSACLLISSF
jgi:hypothetical protein